MVFRFGNNNNNNNAQSALASFFSSSTSSSSSCDEQQQEDLQEGEGRVEVTVQRLDGVLWVDHHANGSKGCNNPENCNSNINSNINTRHHHQKLLLPHLTATVSFSGSAEDMQIGSSTVCGLTGQLLVESAPMRMIRAPLDTDDSDSCCAFVQSSSSSPSLGGDPLIPAEHVHDQAKNDGAGGVWLTAEWPEDVIVKTTAIFGAPSPTQPHVTDDFTSTISNSAKVTTAGVAVVQQPHVRMQFPGAHQADPLLPKPCLVQSNRGSKIVKEQQQQQQQQQNSSHHHHHHHHPAAACGGHKKTNSNITGLETAATSCITDFTSFSSEEQGEQNTPPPALSPSSSSSSSSSGQQDQLLNHEGTTSTSITGMEKLMNHHHYHQQQNDSNVNDNNNNNNNNNNTDAATQNSIAIAMVRGESAFWSHSGKAMPEILELYIRLRCHDSSQNFAEGCMTNLWEGVSFLVLFGQEDDEGSHIIDLPVRRPYLSVDPADSEEDLCFRPVGGKDASHTDGPRLLLTSHARLRLKVTIIPDKLRRNRLGVNTPSSSGGLQRRHAQQQQQQQQQPLMKTSIDAPSLESPVEVSLTRSTLEAKLKPLMDKIRENELLALQQWQAQKRAMDVHVPVPLNSSNSNLNKKNERNAKKSSYFYYPVRGPQYSIQDGGGCKNYCDNNNGSDSAFANMIWSWDHVVNLITMPCGSCDGRFSSAVVDPGNDKDGVLLQRRRGNNSPLMINMDTTNFLDDSSTIATHESWGV